MAISLNRLVSLIAALLAALLLFSGFKPFLRSLDQLKEWMKGA